MNISIVKSKLIERKDIIVIQVRRYEKNEELTKNIELKLDEADKEADLTDVRYTHEEVFSRARAHRNPAKIIK